MTNEQESPLDGTQKNWTQPVYVKTSQDLISRMDDKLSKVFNAHQNLEPTSTGALARAINRARQRDRPGEPTDLLFELDMERVTNFLQADIRIRSKWHLIFATSEQLLLSNQTLYWYFDGTFKIVRRPFEQLWIIHAFIASGSKYKQEPLLYALMSRRRISDYTSVLRK